MVISGNQSVYRLVYSYSYEIRDMTRIKLLNDNKTWSARTGGTHQLLKVGDGGWMIVIYNISVQTTNTKLLLLITSRGLYDPLRNPSMA